MDTAKKLREDWATNQHAKTRAIDGKPWGWQWGGQTVFQQVANLGILPHLFSPVLDVGCGGGKWEKWLIDNYGLEVWGVDVHEQAIKESREYEPRAEFMQIAGEGLDEFADSSFGTVFIFDVLLHLPMFLVARYFQEAFRVATRTLIFSIPSMSTELGGRKFMKAVSRQVWRRCFEYGYMSYYTPGQIGRMLQLTGWINHKVIGYIGARGNRDMVVVGVKGGD